jgi:hypothetical protein
MFPANAHKRESSSKLQPPGTSSEWMSLVVRVIAAPQSTTQPRASEAFVAKTRSIESKDLEHIIAEIATLRHVGEWNLPTFTRASFQR